MRLAPNISLRGALRPLSDGLAGVYETLGAMRALVRQYRVDPGLRSCAAGIAFLAPEKDQCAEACAIFEYVRDHIRYLQDVNGVETLQSPDKTLLFGQGDCDDQSVLLATLLESIGYPTRFVIHGYSDGGEYEHVFLEVLCRGAWIACDPTESFYFGWAPPDPVIEAREVI